MITFEEAKELSKGYKVVPISMEIMSDIKTPMQVLRILKGVSSHCYMLESVENQEKWGRYTFLGYDPKLEITCTNGVMTVKNGKTEVSEVKHPGEKIKEILKEYTSPKIKELSTFTGGLVGYFSYDYIKYSEPKLNLDANDEEGFKDVDLMLFDKVIAFDNFSQKIIVIANARTENLREDYDRCVDEINKIIELIRTGEMVEVNPGKITSEFRPLFTEIEVAGASPETLVKLEDGVLHTFPLAGTKPRGKNKEEDDELEKILLTDEKERAEHNMLVDLGRNDIGKISKFGTVEVENYMDILRYSHVMHIGSTVKGEIRDDKTSLDAVDAVLPAGTLSGAPKIRAMEIINELENNKRGIYGGAIGYIDFTGNLDTCIAIRTAFKKNGKVFVRSGAGIVADSVPESEYNECINKAKAVMNAVSMGQESI